MLYLFQLILPNARMEINLAWQALSEGPIWQIDLFGGTVLSSLCQMFALRQWTPGHKTNRLSSQAPQRSAVPS